MADLALIEGKYGLGDRARNGLKMGFLGSWWFSGFGLVLTKL